MHKTFKVFEDLPSNLIKFGILKLTGYHLLKFKVNFKIPHLISFFNFEKKNCVHWPELNGKNTPYVNFWNHHSNYSKLDDFEHKKLITTRAINWCQKLPNINLYFTRYFWPNILFFNPFPKNLAFPAFSLKVSKSAVEPSPIIPKSTQLNSFSS